VCRGRISSAVFKSLAFSRGSEEVWELETMVNLLRESRRAEGAFLVVYEESNGHLTTD
jgi:hypothetical protein